MIYNNLSTNIRKDILNHEINDKLDSYLNDNNEIPLKEIYEAKVIDNKDIKKIGRAKVRVYGIHSDEILDKDLPWAYPSNNNLVNKYGSIIIPEIDQIVGIIFHNGDVYLPKYIININKINQLPPSKNTAYPDNIIILETKNGTIINFRRDTEEINIEQKSNAKINIAGNGIITIQKDNNFIELTTLGITISGGIVTITGGILNTNGLAAPTGTGPFCAIPIDPLTGLPHLGNQVVGT
jgi:hypothetical protein